MNKIDASTILLTVALAATVFGQTSWTISSPGDKVKATVQLADLGGQADYPSGVRLYYSVSAGGPSAYSEVVQPSPMGITRQDQDFTDSLQWVSESEKWTIDSSYTMITGKRSLCRNYCSEKVLTFRISSGEQLELFIRAYDDGFAFRYRFPGPTAKALYMVKSEATGFRPPANSTMWMLAYNTTADTYAPAYEDIWQRNLPAGAGPGAIAKPTDSTWCMPALFRTPGGCWALLWETDVTPSYCNSHLSKAHELVYRIAFPNPSEARGLGSATPTSSSLPWTMPWRVIITGMSPGTILESTLSTDLATPSVIEDVSWIKPGRASWSWWSDNSSPKDYSKLLPFIDLAQQMTWEYSTIDEAWHTMTNGNWRQLAAYAAEKNVGLFLWYNSGGPINSISASPRDSLYDSLKRVNQFQTISAAGIKGVKMDFWLSDKQDVVKYYWNVFRDAAAHHLLVNPHGSTIPRGWQRTYPNLITAEAVRGAENYIWYKDDGARFPWQNTLLPFTRNAVASMDWTPVTFTHLSNRHLTTYGHELALSVIFESGVQHFADRVAGYQTTTIPEGAQAFLRQVPVAWDDTKYVQGYPGSWIVIARRKGNDWYAAGIAGDTARNMVFGLSFLQKAPSSYEMTLITDGANDSSFSQSVDTVDSGDSIGIDTRIQGGWVAKFVNLNPVGIGDCKGNALSERRVESGHFLAIGESIRLPKSLAGKKVELSVYSIDGKLLRRAIVNKNRMINFTKDLALSKGVYVVQYLSTQKSRGE